MNIFNLNCYDNSYFSKSKLFDGDVHEIYKIVDGTIYIVWRNYSISEKYNNLLYFSVLNRYLKLIMNIMNFSFKSLQTILLYEHSNYFEKCYLKPEIFDVLEKSRMFRMSRKSWRTFKY